MILRIGSPVTKFPQSLIITGMCDDWRGRLHSLIRERGKTMKDVSLDAGLGAGYVHSILRGTPPREPSVENLQRIMQALAEPVATLFEEPDRLEARRRLARIAGKLPQDRLALLEAMASAMLADIPPPQPEARPGKSTNGSQT